MFYHIGGAPKRCLTQLPCEVISCPKYPWFVISLKVVRQSLGVTGNPKEPKEPKLSLSFTDFGLKVLEVPILSCPR
jgi:hypothetical protein